MKSNLLFLFVIAIFCGCSTGTENTNENANAETATDTSTNEKNNAQTQTPKQAINDVYPGMPHEQLVETLGRPSKIDTLNPNADQLIQDWWYGSNRKIRIIDGKVNRVVRDVAKEQEILNKIVEAKKNNDEEEVKRLMEELTKGNY